MHYLQCCASCRYCNLAACCHKIAVPARTAFSMPEHAVMSMIAKGSAGPLHAAHNPCTGMPAFVQAAAVTPVKLPALLDPCTVMFILPQVRVVALLGAVAAVALSSQFLPARLSAFLHVSIAAWNVMCTAFACCMDLQGHMEEAMPPAPAEAAASRCTVAGPTQGGGCRGRSS